MRNPLRGMATSALVLVPCVWQRRIQAGDLASHAYNAWLANVHSGNPIPGIVLVPQLHNVLFDLLLGSLMPRVRPGASQTVGVSIAVLIFSGALHVSCGWCRAVARGMSN